MRFLVCYINGSCCDNDLQRATESHKTSFASGAGIFYPESFRFLYSLENMSIPIRKPHLCKNNAAELIAFRECLKVAELLDISRLFVYSHSDYLTRGFNEFILRWSTNGWLNSKGLPLENIKLWQEIWELKNKVPGRSSLFPIVPHFKSHIYSLANKEVE